jgi:hypothetical protein
MAGSRYLLLLFAAVLGGCATTTGLVFDDRAERLDKPATELSEHQLLDVWIQTFDPGELPVDSELAQGLSMDIREAEARFIPIQLADTMEKTGYWGSVRVVPAASEGGEVLVRGRIVASDGGELRLEISASDATGQAWFSRVYGLAVDPEAYRTQAQPAEVFQGLYNRIANDLARHRNGLSATEVLRIRRVAEMRFARDLAPDAFARYLQIDEDGEYSVVGLPAASDPMYRRILAIRQRDFLLIDTLNGHFDNYYLEMQAPYTEWRSARTEELEAYNEIKREAWQRKALGVAAIAGAVALGVMTDGDARVRTGTLRDVMVLGGLYGVKSGFDKDAETGIHRAAIEELDASFSAEASPLVVEIDGETHELTGSAEVQYEKWRDLLRQIYASETGLVEVTD